MPYAVRFTERALIELDNAFQWLSERSRAAAVRWQEQLLAENKSLETNPLRCGLAPESERSDVEIRQLVHGKRRHACRILFEIRGRTVYLLRIRHAAQALLEPDDL